MLSASKEIAGDDEAGDHEEDVDADVATGEGSDPCVVEDDRYHGDCTEALDVWSEPMP